MGTVAVVMYWAQVHLTAPCVRGSLLDHQLLASLYASTFCLYLFSVNVVMQHVTVLMSRVCKEATKRRALSIAA